jgi:hypothetical protein
MQPTTTGGTMQTTPQPGVQPELTDALMRRVRAAREQYGPRSVRWPESAQRAKRTLASRGHGA